MHFIQLHTLPLFILRIYSFMYRKSGNINVLVLISYILYFTDFNFFTVILIPNLLHGHWEIIMTSWSVMVMGNGMSLIRHRAITWINVDLLTTGTFGKNFNEILMKTPTTSFQARKCIKKWIKMTSSKLQPFVLALLSNTCVLCDPINHRSAMFLDNGLMMNGRKTFYQNPSKWWSRLLNGDMRPNDMALKQNEKISHVCKW